MEMENHPIKAIMDLSHLVRRATEQQMADLEISSVQSRVLAICGGRPGRRNLHFRRSWKQSLRSAGHPCAAWCSVWRSGDCWSAEA